MIRNCTMQTPTTTQIETAIDVLAKLGERLNIEAAHFIVQLPKTQIGTHYAGSIGSEIIEQILHIESIAKKLEIWGDELEEQTKCDQAEPGMTSRFNDVLEKCIVLEEKYFTLSRASSNAIEMGNFQTSVMG